MRPVFRGREGYYSLPPVPFKRYFTLPEKWRLRCNDRWKNADKYWHFSRSQGSKQSQNGHPAPEDRLKFKPNWPPQTSCPAKGSWSQAIKKEWDRGLNIRGRSPKPLGFHVLSGTETRSPKFLPQRKSPVRFGRNRHQLFRRRRNESQCDILSGKHSNVSVKSNKHFSTPSIRSNRDDRRWN